jgi:hypothetical protein
VFVSDKVRWEAWAGPLLIKKKKQKSEESIDVSNRQTSSFSEQFQWTVDPFFFIKNEQFQTCR